MVATTCTHWSIIYPAPCLERRNFPIARSNWTRIACFCVFEGLAYDGGVKSGDTPVGVSGSGISKV